MGWVGGREEGRRRLCSAPNRAPDAPTSPAPDNPRRHCRRLLCRRPGWRTRCGHPLPAGRHGLRLPGGRRPARRRPQGMERGVARPVRGRGKGRSGSGAGAGTALPSKPLPLPSSRKKKSNAGPAPRHHVRPGGQCRRGRPGCGVGRRVHCHSDFLPHQDGGRVRGGRLADVSARHRHSVVRVPHPRPARPDCAPPLGDWRRRPGVGRPVHVWHGRRRPGPGPGPG